MKRNILIILVAIILAAAAAAGAALREQAHPASTGEDGRKLFPDLAAHAGDIASIEITTGTTAIVMKKQGEDWIIPAKSDYPANLDKIRDLVSAIAGLVMLEPKTSDPSRYDQLGLADPGKDAGAGRLIKLLDSKGTPVVAAVFGRSAPSLGRSGGGLYVRRQGEPQAWLVQGLFQIPDTVLSWAAPIAFDAGDPKAVKSVTIADGTGKPVLTFIRAKPDDDLFTAQPALPGKPDSDKIGRLADTTASLGFDDVRPISSAGAAKPSRIIVFEGFDGAKYRLSLIPIGKDFWAGAEQQSPSAKSFSPVHGGFLYKLQDYRLGLLQANAKDFVTKQAADPNRAAHPVAVHP